MPLIIVTQFFKFAHQGIHVEEFEPSERPRDTTDECAEIAVREGWAQLAKSEAQLAAEEAQRQADAAAEAKRQADAAAEARRQADADAEAKRQADADAEAKCQADAAAAGQATLLPQAPAPGKGSRKT